MGRMTLDLDEATLRAIDVVARERGLTREQMTAEIVTDWLEGIGAVAGELTVPKLTRFTPTEGEA